MFERWNAFEMRCLRDVAGVIHMRRGETSKNESKAKKLNWIDEY